MTHRVRVGLIGASPTANWATRTHIPATRAVPEIELFAVATTKAESAQATADAHSIPRAHGSAAELIQDSSVDVVAIVVRPPFHFDLVVAALRAGKHVLCEWPLVPTSEQAHQLLELARSTDRVTAVGLQGRCSPTLNYVRELIEDGFIGELMSCTVNAPRSEIGSDMRTPDRAYTAFHHLGTGLMFTAGGHTLDAVAMCTSEFHSVAATTSVHFKSIRIEGTDDVIEPTAPDQLALTGTLADGAVVSVHVHGGKANGGRLEMEFSGTRGDLHITTAYRWEGGDCAVQKDRLFVHGATGRGKHLAPLDIPNTFARQVQASQHEWHYNLAQLYSRMASAIAGEPVELPDFALAEQRTLTLEAAYRSSVTGERVLVPTVEVEVGS